MYCFSTEIILQLKLEAMYIKLQIFQYKINFLEVYAIV